MSMRPVTLRARSGAWYLLVTALCVMLATACGTVSATGGGAAGSSSPSAAMAKAKAAKISLDITVTSAGAKAKHWTLQCEPAGGTHPDPAAACRVLLAGKYPFAAVPKGVMCPMIVAGTKRALVTGTWLGKKVDMTLFRGGCYLGRWAKIGQIFN